MGRIVWLGQVRLDLWHAYGLTRPPLGDDHVASDSLFDLKESRLTAFLSRFGSRSLHVVLVCICREGVLALGKGLPSALAGIAICRGQFRHL